KQLAKSGVPRVPVSAINMSDDDGQFDPTTWSMDVNNNLLNKSSLSLDEMRDLGNTVYHEARHAEQGYSAAQFLSGQSGATATGVSSTMGIPQKVADSAFANSVSGSDYRAIFGETMYNGYWGTLRSYRNSVMIAVNADPHDATKYSRYHELPKE